MTQTNVPGDEWVELVPSNFENDYSVVVEDAPIFLYPGDKPARPKAGLPLGANTTQSGEVDRGVALWGRAQGDDAANVRVVPNIRIDGSNERSIVGAVESPAERAARVGEDRELSSVESVAAGANTAVVTLLNDTEGEGESIFVTSADVVANEGGYDPTNYHYSLITKDADGTELRRAQFTPFQPHIKPNPTHAVPPDGTAELFVQNYSAGATEFEGSLNWRL